MQISVWKEISFDLMNTSCRTGNISMWGRTACFPTKKSKMKERLPWNPRFWEILENCSIFPWQERRLASLACITRKSSLLKRQALSSFREIPRKRIYFSPPIALGIIRESFPLWRRPIRRFMTSSVMWWIRRKESFGIERIVPIPLT